MPEEAIVYAPDVVGVGRLFMIALKVPIDAPEVQVVAPKEVTLLDFSSAPLPKAIRLEETGEPPQPPNNGGSLGAGPPSSPHYWGAGGAASLRRFYFRATQAAKAATIRFALPTTGGPPAARRWLAVPVEIWSFEELRGGRALKGTTLPRRWPLGAPLPELKAAQTVTTPAEAAALKGNPGSAPSWLDASDDAIWAMQPDSTLPRWHWVNLPHGCPVHGKEIYAKQPYYPWEKDLSLPWKWQIRCPVGGEVYPSNDVARGDMTSGAFPDDGMGGGFVVDGRHYGFIAEISQAYCHQMLRVAPDCAQGYLATGDHRYVHKALVAFCRLAVEYAYLATMTHHRHRNSVRQVERFGQGRFDEGPFLGDSGFTVYHIDQPSYQSRLAEAYDRVFPAIDQDTEILPFLREKALPVKCHEDLRRFIEENLFAVWMQGSMDGACRSNEPFAQRGFARMAEVLNYARGAEFMDWLYDGEGKMPGTRAKRGWFVTNGFFRDGAPYESTGGYNGMHVSSLGPIVESIEHLRSLRPEVYPEAKYPSLVKSRRYRQIFDFDMDTVTLDRSFPAIGDTGGHPAFEKLERITWQSGGAEAFEHAYRLYREPKLAWALARSPDWKPSVGFPAPRAEIERAAAAWPDDWNDRSSLHDGYGLAILRGGKGDAKRALWLRYGRARGHTQDDLMDIGLQAYQGVLLSHMGYPRNWGYWEHNWTSHHLARQIPFTPMTAQAQLFADAGPIHLAEARAQGFADEVDAGDGYRLVPDVWQRRCLALVDVGPDQFYAIDLYRIAGGKEHWWAFHAQEGGFQTRGVTLTRQEGGTLAGPDVPYADPKWLEANGCTLGTYGWSGPMFAFAHLYNAERGHPRGVWSADWALKDADGLHLRLTVLSEPPKTDDQRVVRTDHRPPATSELIVCDGKSPAGGSPYEMKWLFLHHAAPSVPDIPGSGAASHPLHTQVVGLLEPYVKEPLIREARTLRLSGADEDGFAAAGCVLRLADRVDTLLYSADPEVERTAEGGVRFAGRFGFFAERDGRPVAMALVGGTRLSKGDVEIRLESPEYRGRITKLDRDTETIVVSPALADPASVVEQVLFITSPSRRSAYKVLAAKSVPGGTELRLDQDSRIGTGRVTGTALLQVKTDTPFPLHRFRYYHDAHLVNAARDAEYRIVEVRDRQAAFIDATAHPEVPEEKLAREFPGGTWFDIYDYGLGDDVVWPYAVSVIWEENGQYRVNAPVPVRSRLPGAGVDAPEVPAR